MKKKIAIVLLWTVLCLCVVLLAACKEEHVHDYGAWEVTDKATCLEAGTETRSCDCGESETREIAATGSHSYGSWDVTKEADCGTKGERMRMCKGCGKIDTEKIAASKEHLYGAENICAVCNDEWEYSQGLLYELVAGGSSYAVVGNDSVLEGVLTIPYYHNGLPVTAIGTYAFRGSVGITEVVLPDLITAIYPGAFSDCTELNVVTFESNSHLSLIGEFAFAGTALASFTIGSDVVAIGAGAFSDCDALEELTVASDNIRFTVKNGSLIDLASKTLMTAGVGGIVPADGSVTSIAAYAFSSAVNAKIQIPASVTEIAPDAFAHCVTATEVSFAEDGWYVTETRGAQSGTAVSVADALTNLTNLKTTYVGYYWYRADAEPTA